jgi:hypothetical protein
MADIVEKLPTELANIVYSYLGKSDTAVIMEEYFFWKEEHEWNYLTCKKCKCSRRDTSDDYILHVDMMFHEFKYGEDWVKLCEYCYAEEFGEQDVYTCCKCNNKTHIFGDFNNTEEDGLFCNYCYEDYLEELEEQ